MTEVNLLCPRFLRGQVTAFQGIKDRESDMRWLRGVGKAPPISLSCCLSKITQERDLSLQRNVLI